MCFGVNEFMSLGVNEFMSLGVNEFMSLGVNEFMSLGVNEFMSLGVNESMSLGCLYACCFFVLFISFKRRISLQTGKLKYSETQKLISYLSSIPSNNLLLVRIATGYGRGKHLPCVSS